MEYDFALVLAVLIIVAADDSGIISVVGSVNVALYATAIAIGSAHAAKGFIGFFAVHPYAAFVGHFAKLKGDFLRPDADLFIIHAVLLCNLFDFLNCHFRFLLALYVTQYSGCIYVCQ